MEEGYMRTGIYMCICVCADSIVCVYAARALLLN